MLKMLKNKVLGSTVALCALLIVTTLLLLVSSSFAYFKAIIDTQGVNSMMIELIFDRLDFTDPTVSADTNFDQTATWGTEKNPYVISQKYHVQNLSVLQNAGFFKNRLEADGTTPIQAHFLVSTTKGTPVSIDCQGMTIAPVGSHKLPFTGVIKGAPYAGETTYEGYGTSVSTIANLTVETTLGEPDIGFFGRLGYHGTKGTNTETGGPTLTGYAAVVEDLVLADVTIKSRFSLGQALAEWWASLTGTAEHLNHANENFESHHVGIIAGHAEFATVNDVSVFYSSNDVKAFDLVSSNTTDTSYYSSTGLLGLLDCVNPVEGENGVLDGSNAISDSGLVGDGSSGGGGDESGSMTGYFLAKNLFDRHEEYLTANSITTKDKYSVTEMKDADGSELFKTVTMAERDNPGIGGWRYRNYFYFQDTVFTFAMSMSVASNENGTATETPDESKTDYIQSIWRIAEDERPSISATNSLDSLSYGPDPTAKAQIAYALEAVTSLTEGGYYVLAYLEKNGTDDTTDDVLYVLNLHDTNGAEGYVYTIPADEIYGDPVYENGYIKSLYLLGTSPVYYEYTFQYNKSSGYPISKPDSDEKFGITATDYSNPTTVISTSGTASGSIMGATAFKYDWEFNNHPDNSYRVSITGTQRFGGSFIVNNYRYGWSKLQFDNGALQFYTEMSTDSGKRNETIPLYDNNYFTIFKVNTNTYDGDGNINNTDVTGNIQLTPKNILPDTELYSFDPSKYVLQFVDGDENTTADDSYKLLPIRSLKLNNGQGDLLEEINHIAKLYKTHNQNYQLTIGNLFSGAFGDLINNVTKTNTGGVLNTTIGTSNDEVYSIPTGMIAFEINQATVDNPSYINIIVAVNPEQETTGTVGLWAMNKETWQQSFDVSNPTFHFDLPISKTAKGISDMKYAIKISERVVESEIEGKKIYNTVLNADDSNETSYMYLGGETVLVYHTFEVTSKGVYMLGSKAGPLSVAYFSVTGAAGEGNDGMSGSPLGNVDFVYAFNNKIITTDKHYEGDAPLISLEDYEDYYPSYLFVGMLPGENNKIQQEVIYINRYISTSDASGTKRHLRVVGESKAAVRGVSPIMQDVQDDLDDE